MDKALEFLTINGWHTFMSLANLLILMMLLKRFLFKPVQDILKKRQDEIDGIYGEAETSRQHAQQDKELYAQKMSGAKTEAETLIQTATENATRQKEEILLQAKQDAERTKTKAQEEIELSREKALVDMREDISDIVIDLAQQVVGREIKNVDHDSLINNAIDRLAEN